MKIERLPELESDEIERLRAAGISTSRQLVRLAWQRSRFVALAESTMLPPDRLRLAVNWAQLGQIRGVGPATLTQLRKAGVASVADLAALQPESLYAALQRAVNNAPNLAVIESWIIQARRQR